MINITIIEDNKSYAQTLQKIINQEEDVRCESLFYNSSSAYDELDIIGQSDVIVTDIQLPDYTGLELISKIKEVYPDKKCLVLTVFEEEDKLFSALKIGACGYVLKSDPPAMIIDDIRQAHYGGAPMSASIAKKVVEFFYKSDKKHKSLDELSNKENEILELLSKGLLYKEIADQQSVTIDTIKKHCGNIYRKLEVCNRTEALNIYFQN